jgi:hypothetical protein
MIRIPVDFNTASSDKKKRVYINTRVDKWLLDYLKPGLRVLLYEPDLEVEAVVEYDEEYQGWFGIPDWSTRYDPPFPPEEK